MSTAAAVILFAVVVLYAVFAGADFGAGFWDLTAGSPERGRRARGLIDRSIGPVWEANHVWLVFCLVILWTAFPTAFAAIMSTLYIPLGLAALGIVLRGSGFAFRKVSVRLSAQQLAGSTFAASSVVTPFFLGTVAGGIASGRVPLTSASGTNGDALTSWLNPTSVLGGALAVVTCAYLAAVFLTIEARVRNDAELEAWFRRRVRVSAASAGVLATAGIAVLHADAHRLFHQLLGPGLPLVLLSAASGLAAIILVDRQAPFLLRALAVTAVASVVAGWGAAQYPYLLGTRLRITEGAAPDATLTSVVVIFAVAAVLCLPSLAFLYVLQQRGQLEGT
ncbi:MAG TPA: cytochrome d ubiquinol oxidase subunit II [Acidimicrobiales bacterium]|nr:cytochrome d ubiquinol oxidase subunit II [Acidimicrobiales bacterium]